MSSNISPRILSPILCTALLLPVGCGFGTKAVVSNSEAPAIGGTVFGGSQPIAGATVNLVLAGTSGYGSTGSILATTTSGAGGVFSLPAHSPCPRTDSLVYVEAIGGDASAGVNSAIHLVSLPGNCSIAKGTTKVSINEATTIAAAYALAPFAKVTATATGIGSSSTNIEGLNRAADTSNTLVSSATGLVNASSTSAGIVLPSTLINTLADILAACVNTAGPTSANCKTLFGATTVSAVAPIDTLQAALNIALHPASGVTSLLTLVSPTPPFQPTTPTTTPPSDFTVAIGYNGSDIGSYGSNGIAIDSTGNAWITTNHTSNTTFGLVEISPSGQYLSGTTGFGSAVLGPTVGIDVDPQDTIWVSNIDNNQIVGFNPDGSVYDTVSGVTSPGGLVVDANGDVWTPARGNNRTFVELLNNLYTSYSLQKPITTIDTNGAGICVSFNTLYELTYPTTGAGSGLTVYNLSTQAVTASLSPDLNAATMNGCAVDSAGNVWIPDAGYYHGIEVFNSSGNLVHSYPINSSLTPQDVAIDGLGNAFVVAYNSNTKPESIVEVTSTGTLVSPALGYSPTTGSANTAGTALVGLTNVITNTPGSAAIDSSGNLWLAGTNDLTTLPSYVTEVVGIAAPVRIPKSIALTSGQLGSRP